MIDGKKIRVRLLKGAPKAWLCLQGTVLSYHGRFWGEESRIDVPLELVSITEKKQFRGSRLIVSLLSLLFLLGIGGAVIGLWHLITGNVPESVYSICMATCTIAGFFIFVVLLVRFFIRQKTISIYIGPEVAAISFWLDKNPAGEIRELLDEIQARKSTIDKTIFHPMSFGLRDTICQPWKRTVALTFLFSIPALVTEIPWLLFACAIPIGMHIYSMILMGKKPPEFRQAVRHLQRREWILAQDKIKKLIKSSPEYIPARLLLIELQMRLDDFDGAEITLADIQNDLDTETIESIQQTIILSRRIFKRKKLSIQQPA